MMSETKSTLKEKLQAIEDFFKIIPESSISFSINKFILSLSFEEILSSDFEEMFLPKLFSYNNDARNVSHSNNTNEMYMLITLENKYFSYYIAEHKLSNEQIRMLYTKLINFLKKLKKPVQSYGFYNINIFFIDKENISFFLLCLLDNKLLNLFSDGYSINSLKDIADKIMSTDNINMINKVISVFSSEPKLRDNYQNYPLVIINNNISKEDKISIIKKTYKQKDLHKYTAFISENLKDLNHLDSFIEATILQNNRVTKKKEVIFDLIRRIFFGIRGTYIHFNYENLLNIESFIKKYKEYIDASMVNELMNSATWSVRNSIRNFFGKMYKNESFKEKLRLILEIRNIGDQIISGEEDIPSEIIGERELEEKFFKFLINNNLFEKWILRFEETGLKYLNIFPDLFASFADSNMNLQYIIYGYNNETIKKLLPKVFKVAEKVFLEKFEILYEKEFMTLGATSDRSYAFSRYVAENAVRFSTSYLKLLTYFSETIPNFKEYLYNKYFFKLENDPEIFLSKISANLNTTEALTELLKNFRVNTIFEAIEKFIFPIKEFAEKIFPDNPMISENLSKISDSLKIICSI